MQLYQYMHASEFLEKTQELYMREEAANNLILGLSLRLKELQNNLKTQPFFAIVQDENSKIHLSSVMTPPYPLIIHGDPQASDAMGLLVNYLLTNAIKVSGVNGKEDISTAFAQSWSQQTGQKYLLDMSMRIYELKNVFWPIMPPGSFRLAEQKDAHLILKYHLAMQHEVELDKVHKVDMKKITTLIAEQTVFLWEVDQKPVSMAMSTRPSGHSICISGVYTPHAERKKGYASACVAHTSHHLLDQGYEFVVLFTDLANPTSNHIYQEIGFRPVCDFLRYAFL